MDLTVTASTSRTQLVFAYGRARENPEGAHVQNSQTQGKQESRAE
jgi:hypothetical protein